MCGIFGKIDFNREGFDHDALEQMAGTLMHRGPDDEKHFAFKNAGIGATRLSIIDLETGAQPISNEKENIWACQNGEIYNYKELAKELRAIGHKFKTNSDTEVLVHLCEEHGEDFVRKLRGMFSLAIWNEEKRTLLLARDRLGIKPLYYTLQNGVFYFASEIKALLAVGVKKEIDPQALWDYLSCNFVPGPRTIFKNIYKLPAGCLLKYEGGKIEKKKYWDLPKETIKARNQKELIKQLREHLEDAVKSHLVSDVPVGAFLSGGIDSSAVVALASQHTSKLQTFSVGFKEKSFNELEYADKVAKQYGTDHHQIYVDLGDPENIKKACETFDEPFADSSAIACHAVAKFARKSVKTVLSGDGGDENFGGYVIYKADKLLRAYRKLPKILKQKFLPKIAELFPATQKKMAFDFKLKRFLRGGNSDPITAHFLWRAILTERQKQKLLKPEWQEENIKPTSQLWHEYHEHHKTDDYLNDMMYLDTKINLADDMLVKVDRTSMANSLEVRVPLLDHILVEFAAKIPGSMKLHNNKLKYIFREAIKDLLPEEILNRPKAGFHVPVASWLKRELKPLIREYLTPSKIASQGFFDPETVLKIYKAHLNGKKDYNRELWGILMFTMWYDKYF